MQPFHQGQLDVFCAIYAVINGLRLTHGIRMATAREILHETLLTLATDRDAFAAVLNQATDYTDLVDDLLERQRCELGLRALTLPKDGHAPDALLTRLDGWLASPGRAAVFRFVRYLPFNGQPYIHHWTCARAVEDGAIRLFDSSRDEGAVHAIDQAQLVTAPGEGGVGRILVEPCTVRLLARR